MRLFFIVLVFLTVGTVFGQNNNKCKNSETVSKVGSKIQQQILRNYDKFNNLVEEEIKTYFTEKPVTSKTIFEYSTSKRLIKTTKFLENIETSSVTHEYNNFGKLVSESVSNKKGTLSSETFSDDLKEKVDFYENGTIAASEKTKYNNGKLSEINKFNNQNKLTSVQKFEYNDQGLEIYYSKKDVLGNVFMENKTQYNSLKKPSKIEEYLEQKLISTLNYQYDNLGRLFSQTKVDKNQNEEYRVEYYYNALNLEIESKQYFRGKQVNRVEKTYDEKNNLILETTFDNLGQKKSETSYKYNCI